MAYGLSLARCVVASVACSLARELLSQACQRRRRLELSRACAAVQGGTNCSRGAQMGCRNDAYAKPAKGNHELAACKTLGFSPRPKRLIATGRGTTPGRRDAVRRVKRRPNSQASRAACVLNRARVSLYVQRRPHKRRSAANRSPRGRRARRRRRGAPLCAKPQLAT